MASYDYRCRACDSQFEVRRAVTEPAAQVLCPAGHADVARVWSAVALGGSSASGAAPAAAAAAGGGCCGGGCCG
jgi:putative FmdB family regulatory protein